MHHSKSYISLIARIAQTKKPMFFSTGAASIDEISEAVQVARQNGAEEILLSLY